MKVWPKNEQMRKMLKHPTNNGIAFPDQGPQEWPDDTFTARRVADGDIFLVDPAVKKSTPDVGKA